MALMNGIYKTPNSSESLKLFDKDLLNGKVVFVTGGGSGICKNQTLALMQHGAKAVILGRNLQKTQNTAKELSQITNGTCLGYACDVRNYNDVASVVNETIKQFDRIDIVICGAAGNFLAPISNMSPNAFKTVIDIDLIGTYNTVKATLPHLRESRGRYIHITATLHERATPFQVHVSAAKAGVEALSNVLAVEEGINGITSNCIAPGPIGETEGMSKLAIKIDGDDTQSKSPLGRWGTFNDVNNLTVFLSSPASSFLTGQTIRIDGGERHTRHTANYPYSLIEFENYIKQGKIEDKKATKERQAKL